MDRTTYVQQLKCAFQLCENIKSAVAGGYCLYWRRCSVYQQGWRGLCLSYGLAIRRRRAAPVPRRWCRSCKGRGQAHVQRYDAAMAADSGGSRGARGKKFGNYFFQMSLKLLLFSSHYGPEAPESVNGLKLTWCCSSKHEQITLPDEPPSGCSFAFGLRITGVTYPSESADVSGGPKCPAGWYCPSGSLIRYLRTNPAPSPCFFFFCFVRLDSNVYIQSFIQGFSFV